MQVYSIFNRLTGAKVGQCNARNIQEAEDIAIYQMGFGFNVYVKIGE